MIVENHKELDESVRYLGKCCSEFSFSRSGANTKLMNGKGNLNANFKKQILNGLNLKWIFVYIPWIENFRLKKSERVSFKRTNIYQN